MPVRSKIVQQNQAAEVVGTQLLRALEDKEDELDEEIRQLEQVDDDDLERIRERCLRDMKSVAAEAEMLRGRGHGQYQELNEKEFFDAAKSSFYMVVQFYRPTTRRCEILDKHLILLCKKYLRTRFVKINAEKSHFLAHRGDQFSTSSVERVLKDYGVVGNPIPKAKPENEEN